MTEQCVGACDQRTSPESVQNAHAVLMCIGQSGAARSCGDAVMQPTYNVVGALIVPPPQRQIGLPDIAGEWTSGDGAVASYANAQGQYAGFQSVSISRTWRIDAGGTIAEDFAAGGAGMGGASGFKQHNVGHVIDNGNG